MTKPLARQRSPRWAFMETFEIPEFDGDGNYLTRLRIIQTPWFSVYLHRFDAPDSRPTLHDHPWNFTAIILRGGYSERRLDPKTMKVNEHHVVRHVNRMRIGDAHSIMQLFRNPTWSLVFVGTRRRTWGYWEPANFGLGWTWTEFDKHPHALEFTAAMARRRAAS